MSASGSAFVSACKSQPTSFTPVWFMRQAGRYMPEYRAIRKRHSLLEICKNPQLAAEVTIIAAEQLGVDAAIIFADLLLPLEVMGLGFQFSADEGPVLNEPLRCAADINRLVTHRTEELGYVAEAVKVVATHFKERLPVIGFCGAPFTLASYMIEGSGSRNYVNTKKLMYTDRAAWDQLMSKLVTVLTEYGALQISAGADVLQVFDSWVGTLGADDYRHYVLPWTGKLVQNLRSTGVPIIYFGTDTAMLLPAMKETGAEVIGVDWRIPLDVAWQSFQFRGAVQGNLDPAALFAPWKEVRLRAEDILRRARGRPGHIFNLGHGILPDTPVENVRALAKFVHEHSAKTTAALVQ